MSYQPEKDPTNTYIKTIGRRTGVARYLFGMIDGENHTGDVGQALVDHGWKPNLNVALNAVSILTRDINLRAQSIAGFPLIVKETVRSPYSANPALMDEYLTLRRLLLPTDDGAVDPDTFMSDAFRHMPRLTPEQRQRKPVFDVLCEKLRSDLDDIAPETDSFVVNKGRKIAMPNAKIANVIRTCLQRINADEQELTAGDRKVLELSSLQLSQFNDRALLMTGKSLFEIEAISKPKKATKVIIDSSTLADMLRIGDVLTGLADIGRSIDELVAFSDTLDIVNDYLGGKRRDVGITQTFGIEASLLIRELLRDFDHEDSNVALRRKQLLFMLDKHLQAWGVATKKDRSMYAMLSKLAKSRAEFPQRNEGACNGIDPDLFFPERGASTADAKEVCRGCSVRGECLEYALASGEKFGIWGGLSERERRRIRKERRVSAPRKSSTEIKAFDDDDTDETIDQISA